MHMHRCAQMCLPIVQFCYNVPFTSGDILVGFTGKQTVLAVQASITKIPWTGWLIQQIEVQDQGACKSIQMSASWLADDCLLAVFSPGGGLREETNFLLFL